MKVFVVTAGCYSDFHIEAIFNTKRKAEKFLSDYFGGKNGYDDSGIEEWTLNERLGESRHIVRSYTCVIDLESGNISRQWEDVLLFSDYMKRKRDETKVREPYECDPAGYAYGYSNKSKEHAQKLAAEARQNWMRENSHRIPAIFDDAFNNLSKEMKEKFKRRDRQS